MSGAIICYTTGKIYCSVAAAAKDTKIPDYQLYYCLNHNKRWIEGTEWGYIESVADIEKTDEVK